MKRHGWRILGRFCVVALVTQGALHASLPVPLALAAKTKAAPTSRAKNDVVEIRRKHVVILIRSSDRGALYSVKTHGGKTLARNLTLAQLKRVNPLLYHYVKTTTPRDIGRTAGRIEEKVPNSQAAPRRRPAARKR